MEIKKYSLLTNSLKALSSDTINLLVLKGDQGVGKTHTTLEYLKKKKVNYEYVNTYITPLAFYKLLSQKRNKDIIIFDDLQSINDPKIISMLKSACWNSDGGRIINYHSTSPILEKENLESSFELKANIILIFNKDISGFEPILDRGVTINFNFSYKEKLEILKSFKDKANLDEEVLKFVEDNCSEATKNISIRSLVILSDLKRAGHDFKLFAEEMLQVDNDIKELIDMSAEEWVNETGYSKRTYYRKLRKNNLSTPVQEKREFLKENKIQFE